MMQTAIRAPNPAEIHGSLATGLRIYPAATRIAVNISRIRTTSACIMKAYYHANIRIVTEILDVRRSFQTIYVSLVVRRPLRLNDRHAKPQQNHFAPDVRVCSLFDRVLAGSPKARDVALQSTGRMGRRGKKFEHARGPVQTPAHGRRHGRRVTRSLLFREGPGWNGDGERRTMGQSDATS